MPRSRAWRSSGADLPGSPDVGANNYQAAYNDGLYLAQQANKRFPGKVPYVLGRRRADCWRDYPRAL